MGGQSESSAMNGYTPRGDRVIVKRLPLPEQQAGEMAVPDSQRRPPDEGIVHAVGPDVPDIAVGDHVCFLEHAGSELEIDGANYLSMREVEVHGKRGVQGRNTYCLDGCAICWIRSRLRKRKP